MHKNAVFYALAAYFGSRRRQKGVEFSFWVCYNVGNQLQGSYIGNTTASQAVKAGSIPVPCSNKKVRFVYQTNRTFLSDAFLRNMMHTFGA